MSLTDFTLELNRSERAKQAHVLVPALGLPEIRLKLLYSLDLKPKISKEESDAAIPMHFVWVLRDTFWFDRQQCIETKQWSELRKKWVNVLGLPNWTLEAGWWRHPAGSYDGDSGYVVHPCQRTIGWTTEALRERVKRFKLKPDSEAAITTLTNARRIMNTECDCFIQTPLRLIVIECKDKTEFLTEQRDRQESLIQCLGRLLPRTEESIYVEISDEPDTRRGFWWSWKHIENLIGSQRLTHRRSHSG